MIDPPAASEYAPFFADYVARVPEPDALPALENQPPEVARFFGLVERERETFRYAPDKWSIREIAGHLVDAERLFGFRLFCFARGDQNPLPAFDENEYVARSSYADIPLGELVLEWALVREANLVVIRRLDRTALLRIGTASSARTSVRALARMMVGHVRHHFAVLSERYGVGPKP